MFESLPVAQKLERQPFEVQAQALRTALLGAQRELRAAKIPLIVLLAGVPGSRRGTAAKTLLEWFDARGIRTHAFWDESAEAHERPRWWRFWRSLPIGGQIGVLFGGWYREPLVRREKSRKKAFSDISDFERLLTEDGALIVKFWLHLPWKKHKKRILQRRRAPHGSKPAKPSRAAYQALLSSAQALVEHTDRAYAPWHGVDASHGRWRDLQVGQTLLHCMSARLQAQAPPPPAPVAPAAIIRPCALDEVDMAAFLPVEDYKAQLGVYHERIAQLAWKAYEAGHSTVIAFEGWDAAGKGGVIRRLVQAIDLRLFRVIPVAAPSQEEHGYHYLWRFWRDIPRDGRMTLFDRSWYGRVLVERIEGFATASEWQRAYDEINTFESQLLEHGTVLLKFWLHISQEEQLQRFKHREQTPYKQHKITPEDWRNREKWSAYEQALRQMLLSTDTAEAPWHVIAAQDKRHARIAVLQRVCAALEARLGADA